MNEETQSTIEELLQQIDDIDTRSRVQFTLPVPKCLTLNGKIIRHDVGMAFLVDRILGKGYRSDGFTENGAGRIYRYTRTK
jgi:hypothetical protein